MTNPKTAKLAFLSAILMYGTLGVFVRYAGQPSALLALARSSIGTLFLLVLLAVKRQKIDFAAIRRNWKPLLIAGVLLGLNWVRCSRPIAIRPSPSQRSAPTSTRSSSSSVQRS